MSKTKLENDIGSGEPRSDVMPDAERGLSLLRRLNLNHLITFRLIAEYQSFRAAANRLHISQSALSVHMHQLEDALKVPLFHRTTRSVTLTSEGQRLLPVAQLLTREILLIAGDFRKEAAYLQGIVTLAAPPSIASSFVPPVLKALGDTYPGIRVQMLVKESSKAVAETVRQGEAEIGLLNFSGNLEELNVVTLFEDELVAVVPASERRFTAITHISLRELAESPFLLQPQGSSTREMLELHMRQQGVTVNVRYELLPPHVSVAFVRQGLGVAVLPKGVAVALNLKGCKVIGLHSLKSRAMGLATSTRRSVSPSAGLLRQFLLDASSKKTTAQEC